MLDEQREGLERLDDAGKLRDNDVLLPRRPEAPRVGRQALRLRRHLRRRSPLFVGAYDGKIPTLMSEYDGSQFDVRTGAVLRGPATAAVRTYDVREQDGKIQVRI